MVDSITPGQSSPVGPIRPPVTPPGSASVTSGPDFATQMRQQLEKVSQMQAEAQAGIENLMAGRTDNLTEVFSSARKAEVAFSLLMEIRNKLVDAYTEVRQLRV
jgi:flagellar hook-basal body complex protein FliE